MVDYRMISEDELKTLVKELEEANRLAMEAAKQRGYVRDPRIEAADLK